MNSIKDKINLLKAKQDNLQNIISKNKAELYDLKSNLDNTMKAREVINSIQNETLDHLLGWIEETVNSCLQQVFSGYRFEFKKEEKRNQIELSPIIILNGNEYPPEYCVGGGMLDIISIAMRVAVWAVSKEKTAPIFFLDEPMKNMGALSELGAEIINQLSEKLGLQFIIITHDDKLIDIFKENGKVFRFEQENGATKVINL